MQQHGLAGTFRPLGQLLGVGTPQAGPRAPLRSRSSRPRRVTSLRSKEAVERAVRALPIETYHSRDELESMTIAELKVGLVGRVSHDCRVFYMTAHVCTVHHHHRQAKAAEQSVDVRGVVEKADLVAKIEEEGGTSAASCSICCEDYESGDPMRVLPCRHRFHVEVRCNGGVQCAVDLLQWDLLQWDVQQTNCGTVCRQVVADGDKLLTATRMPDVQHSAARGGSQ